MRTSTKHFIIFHPCLDGIEGSKKHSGTRFHPTRLLSRKIKNFKYTSAEKNRQILKIFSKQVTSYGRPFDLPWHSKIKTWQGLTWLSFIAIHVFLLSSPMLTYPNEEEVGLFDLEESTGNILNKNSWIIFEIWPV